VGQVIAVHFTTTTNPIRTDIRHIMATSTLVASANPALAEITMTARSLGFRLGGLPWWLAPVVLGTVVVIVAAWWADRPPADAGPAALGPPPSAGNRKDLPRLAAGSTLYSVTYQMEHGTKVILIQTVASGDVLVVDAATGRLLDTRPPGPAPKAQNGAAKVRPVE
jgi:hypothetical protein